MTSTFLLLAVVIALALCNLWWWKRCSQIQRLLTEQVARVQATRSELLDVRDLALAERQTLFNSMVESVIVLDPAGRIQLVNRACEKQFELKTDVRSLLLATALNSRMLDGLVATLLPDGSAVTGEMQMSGDPARYFEVSAATILDRDREPSGVVIVLHDVTRLRRLEATRREFVATVSHELRTPVSVIRGGVETLLNGAKEDPVAAERFLKSVERHTLRLSHLLDDLLTLSRLDSGAVVLRPGKTEIGETLSIVLEQLTPAARGRGIRLIHSVATGTIAWVDPDRLEQILVNLIENAVKYGKIGGTVTTETRPLREGMIEVEVRDDGPGIRAEDRERVFERFYRIDKARSSETGGTGLGLSIVKHLVQSHGGQVGVRSEPGQGAEFYFTLPQNAPPLSKIAH
ncbi:MAG: PAS domain-containing protein [Pedosphaera sp.]|nr:PAS domain-containing protein [Pedosphaera sp.]